MKKYVILTLLLIFIFSTGAISAMDADEILSDDNAEIIENSQGIAISKDSQDILESGPDEVISDEDSTKSFAELNDDIVNAYDVLNITRNYKFDSDSDSDYKGGIEISKGNFTINGNGHTIDGNNLSAIFKFVSGNITINDLIFVNANANRGSVFYIDLGCSLVTNNVTFENNTANRGIVYALYAKYQSNNDKFIDSTSMTDGVINIADTYLEINNALMKSSKDLQWGFIYSMEKSFIRVFNSTFANTTSKYSTAVKGDYYSIFENCTFINLHAMMTAGAIGLKELNKTRIKNCNFINVTSQNNGGAIFIDAYDASGSPEVNITDSRFIDCGSQFGGAIMQLEGNLLIDNCNFTNNVAFFDGGAVYTSWCYLSILNTRFINNSVFYDEEPGSFGGAIFFDKGNIELFGSELTNNSAQFGGAIYLYDASYDIEYNKFSNNLDLNGSYNDIYSVFDGDSNLNNSYSGDDSLSLNNTFYSTIIANNGMKLTLINNSITVSSLPSRFDLRDWNWVSPVKNQGHMGSCWAFGSAGAIEGAILRFLGIKMDISENNMQDVSLKYYFYGSIPRFEGGSGNTAANYALSWFGVFPSDYEGYDELGKISPVMAVDSSIHFQDVVIIPPRQNATDNIPLKEALMKYGTLQVSYFAADRDPYYNEETASQYFNESGPPNHGVCLVGWDDNYSRYNFNENLIPPGDGAWIVKNSWGESEGDNGYVYISYYDGSFASVVSTCAFLLENDIEYNKNYQYDIQGEVVYLPAGNEYRNNFVAIDDDLIAAVGTYFSEANSEYEIEIYVNGESRLRQNGLSPFAGYHTIPLNSYVPITKGDEFTVRIKSNMIPVLTQSRQHFLPGSSEIFYQGMWINTTDQSLVCCLKAYTVKDNTKIINNQDVSLNYGNGSFSVKIVTADGHAVGAGEKVNFTINGKTTEATTDYEGIAEIKITEIPGVYEITTEYKGETYKNNVSVSLNFDECKVVDNKDIKVDYGGGKYFSVKVLSADGMVPASGAAVNFNINGKVTTVQTDKNGIAKIKITDIPKKYVIKTTFNGKTYKNTVTVKQVLKTKKVTVKKTAKKFTLKATLKINGKNVKGKKITFKFNGKTYKVKTNKKGIAKVIVKKNVIKKLKKGKKYTVKVTYLKDTIKSTVKVK